MISHFPAPLLNVAPRQAGAARPRLPAPVAPTATFSSLAQAIRSGFQIYDKTDHGYLVRCKTAAGWVSASVDLPTKTPK